MSLYLTKLNFGVLEQENLIERLKKEDGARNDLYKVRSFNSNFSDNAGS